MKKIMGILLIVAITISTLTLTGFASVTKLTASASHSYYMKNKESNGYGKANYIFDIVKISGAAMGCEKDFSVYQLEQLANNQKLGLGYQGTYSLLTRGSVFSRSTMTGLKLYDFLIYCGMDKNTPDSTEISAISKDGYRVNFKLGELRSKKYASYLAKGNETPDNKGLPILLSFGSNGVPLVGPTGDEAVTTVFDEKNGYNKSADNVGGPIRLTIGQTLSEDFNAPLNNKWISQIIVGEAVAYTKHSYGGENALNLNIYDRNGGRLLKKSTYSLNEIENATTSNVKNYYGDSGELYEGIDLWWLLSEYVGLNSYEGSLTIGGKSIDLEYLRNLSGNYSKYVTIKNGLSIKGVRPALVFSKNGSPLSKSNGGYELGVALPSDGKYLKVPILTACKEISLYLDIPKDTHVGTVTEQAITIKGEGIKKEVSYKLSELESKQKFITTKEFMVDGKEATYRGLNLLAFLSDLGLTTDAYQVILKSKTERLTLSLEELRNSLEPTIIAYSRNNRPLEENEGGPIMAVNQSYNLQDIKDIEITIKAGIWKHSDSTLYKEYLDSTVLKIYGSEAKGVASLSLGELEEMTEATIRDSYAASKGKNGYQGIVLQRLISKYLKENLKKPTKITIVGVDGYRASISVEEVWQGIKSEYQPGETRDVILAYSIDGHPLVPTEASSGFSGNNDLGPLRLIMENTISSWVKNVNAIIIGEENYE